MIPSNLGEANGFFYGILNRHCWDLRPQIAEAVEEGGDSIHEPVDVAVQKKVLFMQTASTPWLITCLLCGAMPG